MNFVPAKIYYITNEGNNRQLIFREREEFLIFLSLYKKLFPRYCDTFAWCLLPNCFHLMISTDERCIVRLKQGGIYIDPVTNSVRKLLSGYARIFNHRHNQTGSLFRQKTKARCLTDMRLMQSEHTGVPDYYSNCFRYIHQLPVLDGFVNNMANWEFSSYRDYAGTRDDLLCVQDQAQEYCKFSKEGFRSFVAMEMEFEINKRGFV